MVFVFAAVKVFEDGQNEGAATFYDYDIHGNVEKLVQSLPELEPKTVEYSYDLLSGNVHRVTYQKGETDQFMHRYAYDADNRLEAVFTSSDGYIWDQDARYLYYAHGPMARVELGEYKVQGVDYYYTLQGWIKGVNLQGDHDAEAANNVQKYVSKDAFGYALHYYQNDYQSINGNFGWNASSTTDLFNGNIAAMSTTLKRAGENVMLYQYDQLNRIKNSICDYSFGYEYETDYKYDANGNILKLQRYNGTGQNIDDIRYTYNVTQNNRLQSVNDISGNNEGLESGIHSYTYDEIGNLTSDKDIETINWTVYGKIESVLKRDGTEIDYKYDGTGQRIYKKVVSSSVSKETHYVRDGSGNVFAIYENEVLDELVIYGSSRLGSYNGKTDNGKRTLGNKKYELSNHLGNVLSVISDNKIGIDSDADLVADTYEPLVISESDYYPFGMAMKERSFSNEEYRFGFNGMEKDSALGEGKTDFGNRVYSASLGRWWSIDPYSKKHHNKSTYQAFNNNPIFFIDPDGGDERVSIDEESHTITITSTLHIFGDRSGGWADLAEQNWQKLDGVKELPNGDYVGVGTYTDGEGIPWTVHINLNFNQVPIEADNELRKLEDKMLEKAKSESSPAAKGKPIINFIDQLKQSSPEVLKAMGFEDGDNIMGVSEKYQEYFLNVETEIVKGRRNADAIAKIRADFTQARAFKNMILSKPSSIRNAIHEYFHALGFKERYMESGGMAMPFPGYSGDVLSADSPSKIHPNHFELLAKMVLEMWKKRGEDFENVPIYKGVEESDYNKKFDELKEKVENEKN